MTELIPDIVLDHKVLLNYLPAMASNDLQVTTTEGELVNARGQRLHTLSHCPEPQNSAKAALIFHHGMLLDNMCRQTAVALVVLHVAKNVPTLTALMLAVVN